jgi:NAD(P)-dependent dehydrogenase (short-subunit alcohol dehydrogenase family)
MSVTGGGRKVDHRRRVLVTGSNKGIGLGIVAAYAERGDDVIAACRVSSDELTSLSVQVVDGIELTSDAAVARLADVVGPAGVDVVVCNAAINTDAPSLEEIDVGELAHIFDVNTLGCIRVVLALLPHLRDGAKIMLVSIGAQALNGLVIPTHSNGSYGYRMSKAALTSFGAGLAREVRDRGISVVLSSPGAADTPMLRHVFAEGRTTQAVMDRAQDPLEVGRMFRDRLDELTLDDSPSWQARPDGELVQI